MIAISDVAGDNIWALFDLRSRSSMAEGRSLRCLRHVFVSYGADYLAPSAARYCWLLFRRWEQAPPWTGKHIHLKNP